MTSEKAPAIGINLGTTNSCVGIFQQGNLQILCDRENCTTPSYVAFSKTERLIGDAAKFQIALNPENVVFDSKRLIGKKFDDPKIQQDLENWPFKVITHEDKLKVSVEFKGELKMFNPEEISAMILKKMKEIAETSLNQKVTDAVITVPAYFNDSQRQATIEAGRIADLNVLGLINEPIAVAVPYGLGMNPCGKKTVLVFDLGGGTFDVSVLTIDGRFRFQVISTSGDTHLGGNDFDGRMVIDFVEKFKCMHKKDLRSSPIALGRLRTACEKAKIALSRSLTARIEIDALFEGINFYCKITRARFEELCMDLFCSTLERVEQALADTKLEKNNLHQIILVGGSTLIPKIQEMLRNFFNGTELLMFQNSSQMAAYGAAVQAAVLTGSTHENIKDVLLMDIAAFSLGIETAGGVMAKIVQRNSRIPFKTSTNITLDQRKPRVCIDVFEGENDKVKDNNLLGKYIFQIPPGRTLKPQIEVTYHVDANGILNVSAMEKSLDVSRNINTSPNKGRLSKRDIKRIIDETKQYEKEDVEIKDSISKSNVYSVKHTILPKNYDSLSLANASVKQDFDGVIQRPVLTQKNETEHKMKVRTDKTPILIQLNHDDSLSSANASVKQDFDGVIQRPVLTQKNETEHKMKVRTVKTPILIKLNQGELNSGNKPPTIVDTRSPTEHEVAKILTELCTDIGKDVTARNTQSDVTT